VLQRPDRAAVSDALRDAAKRFGAGLADLSEDQLKELGGEIAERLARVSRIRTHGTQGFLPDHLPFKPILPQLEEHRRTRPFIGPRVWQCFDRLKPGEFQATTIFKWGCHMNVDISVFPGCSRPSTQRGSSDGSSGRRGSQAPSSAPNARAISEVTPPNPLWRSPPVHLILRIEHHQKGEGDFRTTLEGLISLASRAAELFERARRRPFQSRPGWLALESRNHF
jgi:hypothetical protein